MASSDRVTGLPRCERCNQPMLYNDRTDEWHAPGPDRRTAAKCRGGGPHEPSGVYSPRVR